MSIRLNKNAVNTSHVATIRIADKPHKVHYNIIAVHGLNTAVPNGNEPVVYLQASGRYAFPVQEYITLPLSIFITEFTPNNVKIDKFWD